MAANLTVIAYQTRKAFVIGVIALVAFFVVKISFTLAFDIYRKLHPPPPPPPTVAFGKLPKIVFPLNENTGGEPLTFVLETIEGSLPKLPTVSKVYFIPLEGANLLALERANKKVLRMGFKGQPEKVGSNIYRWTTEDFPATTLEMDINTQTFHLKYPYETDQSILNIKNLPTSQQAIQEAKSYLANNDFLAEDLSNGEAKVEYLRFSPPDLIPVNSLSEADFIRVNLFRANLDDQKILPPNPKSGVVSFLFSGSREINKRIIEIKYNYHPIENKTFATYPLRPLESAWAEVKGGQGYIADIGQNSGGKIVIRKVYLAYYDSLEPQNFLQPIFVFEGDKDFFAYTSAIDPKWLE